MRDRVTVPGGHRPARARPAPLPSARAGVDARRGPWVLTPDAVRSLQGIAGNRATAQLVAVQRGRISAVRGKIAKSHARRGWKTTRKWPQTALQGTILERVDKYLFRRRRRGYLDMNKLSANFPAIDGIADGKFRQVKAYLDPGGDTRAEQNRARRATVARIVNQVADLEDKCESAVKWLLRHDARLLRELLRIDSGERGTRGRTGRAADLTATTFGTSGRHRDVLPPSFRTLAAGQLDQHAQNPDTFEFDTDALATEIRRNMVVVVPSELVAAVRREVTDIDVEDGGLTSVQIQDVMDETGYVPRGRSGEDDDPDYTG